MAKKLTSQFLQLDVRRCQREGLLTPGTDFVLRWRKGKHEVGSVTVTVEGDQLILGYTSSQDGLSQDQRLPIRLEWTNCNYGGRRSWLFCPGCGRRTAILYGDGGHFACRLCHNLSYKSQRRASHERALEKAQRIRIELGGSGNMYEPFPRKPRYMHWSTYNRLREQEQTANLASFPPWLIRTFQSRRHNV